MMNSTITSLVTLVALTAQAPASIAQATAFDRILERVRSAAIAHKNPMVVFDLDDTLVRTAPRNYEVLKAWVEQPDGAPYKAGFAKVKVDEIGWGLDSTLDRMGVPSDCRKDFTAFWRNHFFSDAYLKYDLPNPGAVAYAKAVQKAGGRVVYMSGRNQVTMGKGTIESLTKLGFPWDPEGKSVSLVLKTQKGLDDAAFKFAESEKLPALGEIEGAVDNEPGNCNAFHKALPQATVILLEKPHSPNPPALDPGIERAKDFPSP